MNNALFGVLFIAAKYRCLPMRENTTNGTIAFEKVGSSNGSIIHIEKQLRANLKNFLKEFFKERGARSLEAEQAVAAGEAGFSSSTRIWRNERRRAPVYGRCSADSDNLSRHKEAIVEADRQVHTTTAASLMAARLVSYIYVFIYIKVCVSAFEKFGQPAAAAAADCGGCTLQLPSAP